MRCELFQITKVTSVILALFVTACVASPSVSGILVPETLPEHPGWTSYVDIVQGVIDMTFDCDDNLWVVNPWETFQWNLTDGTYIKYTTDDGLASNKVNSVAVGPDCVVWFGTGEGLSRFDGEAWTTYTESDGLANNAVGVVFADSKGVVWVGSGNPEGSHLSWFDGENWTTSSIGLGNWVTSITEAPNGAVWVSLRWGLRCFDHEACGFPRAASVFDFGIVMVNSVAVAPNGEVWLTGGFNGVFHFDGETWTNYTEDDGLIDNGVRCIAVAPDGTVWFGTGEGVSRFDGESWSSYTEDDGLVDDQINCIVIGPDGAVWFGTGGGVSRYVPID